MSQRQFELDRCTGASSLDNQPAFEEPRPFTHGAQADPAPVRAWWDSAALIGDLQPENTAIKGNLDCSGQAAGMTMDIGKRFLHDAKDCQFNIEPQVVQLPLTMQSDLNSRPFGKTFNVSAQRYTQAQLLQQWRMQQV